MSEQDDQQDQSFEQALARLERIVREIEEGKIGLEESMNRYEEGMKLLQHCRRILADAELKIQELQTSADGSLDVKDPQG